MYSPKSFKFLPCIYMFKWIHILPLPRGLIIKLFHGKRVWARSIFSTMAVPWRRLRELLNICLYIFGNIERLLHIRYVTSFKLQLILLLHYISESVICNYGKILDGLMQFWRQHLSLSELRIDDTKTFAEFIFPGMFTCAWSI